MMQMFTYKLWDEWYGFPPGSDVWHAVDVAVEWIVSGVPITIIAFKK